MKSAIKGLFAVGLLVGSMAVQAAPISLSAGDSVIFNFDFSGVTPAPPYASMGIDYQWTDLDLSDGVLREYFDLTGGAGTPFFSDSALVLASTFTTTEAVDGIFSLRITAISGAFSLEPYAVGATAPPSSLTSRVYGVVTSGTVPEPGTLALLGLGIAGLAFTKRRKGGSAISA